MLVTKLRIKIWDSLAQIKERIKNKFFALLEHKNFLPLLNFFMFIGAIAAIAVSIFSIIISSKQYINSSKKSDSLFSIQLSQSENSSKHSDSLFNLQLSQANNSSNKSDSLFNLQLDQSRALSQQQLRRLKDIQKTTEMQNKIVKQQLNQEVYEGRPIITSSPPIDSLAFDTTPSKVDFSMYLYFNFTNTGKRPCVNFSSLKFLVDEKLTHVFAISNSEVEKDHFEPSDGFKVFINSKGMPINFRDTFYSVLQIKYGDELLKDRMFTNIICDEWYYENKAYQFKFCNDRQKNILYHFINSSVISIGSPLLEWQSFQ